MILARTLPGSLTGWGEGRSGGLRSPRNALHPVGGV